MKNYKLYLVRHGITQANLDGIYAGGGTDVPLCEEGKLELLKMQKKYSYPLVSVVFSSPLKRALQTAEILFPAAKEKIVVDELKENNFGEFEGKIITELFENEKFALWLNPENGITPDGGESGADFAVRTAEALKMIFQYMVKNKIFEAACVTHGGVILSMLEQKGLPKQAPQYWMVKNGCGFTLQTNAAMVMRDGSVEVTGTLPLGFKAE